MAKFKIVTTYLIEEKPESWDLPDEESLRKHLEKFLPSPDGQQYIGEIMVEELMHNTPLMESILLEIQDEHWRIISSRTKD